MIQYKHSTIIMASSNLQKKIIFGLPFFLFPLLFSAKLIEKCSIDYHGIYAAFLILPGAKKCMNRDLQDYHQD